MIQALRQIAIGALLLSAIAALFGGVWFWQQVTPQSPTLFYTPPDPLPADAAPGTLLRSARITTPLPDGIRAWRVLYTSTGVDGEPIAVSGVVAAPEATSDTPRPVIAFAQGTIGNLPQCGIGHTDTPIAAVPGIETMIAEGYVVAITDYPGRGTPGLHPYLIGEVAAAAVLDSVRAAGALEEANAGTRFAVWGRSQGGGSSFWVGQRAADYAPDLDLVAVAASAPALDLEGILRFGIDSQSGSVVTAFALTAWDRYYEGQIDLDQLIRPDQRAMFDRLAATCITKPLSFLLVGTITTPEEYLAIDPFSLPEVTDLLAANSPTDPIAVPILITHGDSDGLIPFKLSVAERDRRCAQGESVTLVRYPGLDHDSADEAALMVIGWMGDRLAGLPTPPTCD